MRWISWKNSFGPLTKKCLKKRIVRRRAAAVTAEYTRIPEPLADACRAGFARFHYRHGNPMNPITHSRILFLLCIATCLLFSPSLSAEPPLRIAMYGASEEYKADESLPKLKTALEKRPGLTVRLFTGTDKGDDLDGSDALPETDVAVVFTRRIKLDADDLAHWKSFCAAGRGIVGIRTASHAIDSWPEFDQQILGGDYRGHFGVRPAVISLVNPAHFILSGFKPFPTDGKLYKNPKPAKNIATLLRAKTQDSDEPVAWTRIRGNQRIFYTSLGIPADFEHEAFVEMLVRAVFWTGHRESTLDPNP